MKHLPDVILVCILLVVVASCEATNLINQSHKHSMELKGCEVKK